MQILDLPVETLSTIVEFVRVADHADYATLPSDAICPHNCLKSLSLVCSALRPLAQREHFSHVTLKRPISTQITPPCHRFLDLLNRQPIITSYVRGVVLADKEENHGDKSWILPNADVVANILLRLPHLTSFHIMTTKFVLTWAHIPEILVQAMYTIFQLPSLRTLCLTGFHDLPVDLLDRSPHVQNLHLLRSYFKHPSIQEELHAPFQGITPLSLAPSPQIRHLEIREAFPLCNFPFGCLNVPISSHLETLESFQAPQTLEIHM
ncbi:hypothetical protein BDN72DRAFT_436613 [Pluteus cervinus]|uniref:Uncharacterized protein n=1 Tax=Pluteus cervinus TaxID=181527 RepID=A0ACD3B0H9_9AGAR|nr:hypothetical protein BDN72DRAFT_436613 [Pluteus cervinus]